MSNLLVMENEYIVQDAFTEHILSDFGIDDYKFEYTRHISLFVEDVRPINNQNEVISKSDLVEFIKSEFVTYDKNFIEIFISQSIMNSWDVKNAYGKEIFKDKCLKQGWLVWIDPCKFANWSHECEYWFVFDKDLIYKSKNEGWMPSSDIEIEKVNLD